MIRLLQHEAKLLGLDIPRQVQHSGDIEVKLDLSALTDEDLEALRSLMGRN